MRIMQAYWLLAGLAALYIIALMPWSNDSNSGVWISILVVTAVTVLPMMLIRVDLLDLIIGSTEKLKNHS